MNGEAVRLLLERIAAIAAAVGLAFVCIMSLARTVRTRHVASAARHAVTAALLYNAAHPDDPLVSGEDAARLYETLGGRESLGISFEIFAESLTMVRWENIGQNMVTIRFDADPSSADE